MSTFTEKVKHELRELLPVMIFFIISFELLALTEALILKQYGISTEAFITGIIMALVVAKVVVIMDHFPIVNRFPEKPLAYNIAWKTVIYFLASFLFRYVEHLVHFWRQTGNFGEANIKMTHEIVWPHFWGIQIWQLILLLGYCIFHECVRIVGREKVVNIFFYSIPGQNKKE